MASLAEFYKNYAAPNTESMSVCSSEYLSPSPVSTSDLPESTDRKARSNEAVYPDFSSILDYSDDNNLSIPTHSTTQAPDSNREAPSVRYQSNYANPVVYMNNMPYSRVQPNYGNPVVYMNNIPYMRVQPNFVPNLQYGQNAVYVPYNQQDMSNPYYDSYYNPNYYIGQKNDTMVYPAMLVPDSFQGYGHTPEVRQSIPPSVQEEQVCSTQQNATAKPDQHSDIATLAISNIEGGILAHVSYPIQNDDPAPKPISDTPEQVHGCTICNKVFAKMSYLKQHNNAHHKERRDFKCPKCGKRFSSENACQLHQLKHTGDKPFKCDECPKQYYFMKDLTRHKFVHSTNPYVCVICGKGFARNDHFLRHNRKHVKRTSK